jgi:outer membrane protein OmpA-like peptidoglycan-associated protein
MPSILESVMSGFDQDDGWAELAATVEGDEEQARSAVESTVPVLVGGLAERVEQGDDGRRAVLDLLDAADGSETGPADDSYGRAVLEGVFGDDRQELDDGLAERSEIDADAIDRALPVVASATMAEVARRRASADLDDDQVVALLREERDELDEDGDLGDWFRGLVATGGVGAVLAGLTGGVDDLLDSLLGGDDDADAGSADGSEEADADAAPDDGDVTDADADAPAGAEKVDADAGEDDSGAESGTDDGGDADDDGTAAGAAGAAAGEPAAKTGSVADTPSETTAGRGGLGWLWWALAAVVVVIALALALSQCGGDDDSGDDDAGGGEASVDGEAGDLQSEVDALLPEGVTAEIDGDEVTLSGAVADADAVDEVVDEVSAVEGVGSVVDDLTVDDESAADGSDDEAEEDGEAAADSGDDAGDLQAEIDAVLPDGVTALVEGGLVTLSGTVPDEATAVEAYDAVNVIDGVAELVDEIQVSDDGEAGDLQSEVDALLPEGVTAEIDGDEVTLSGAVADAATPDELTEQLMALDGISSVVADDLAVEGGSGDDSAGAATGATLNEKLGLDPITFRYLSPQVTVSGAAVLDKVAAHLQDNDIKVEIQGHTDSDGSEEDNQELSERRAQAVKDYLVAAEIDAERLSIVGYGETMPKVENDSLAAKAENRRIELVVVE